MSEVTFIAGPMTGRRNFNFDAFDIAATRLRALSGERVINPAENHGGRQDLLWEEYLEESLRQVEEEADVVCVLDGWMESRGAKLEVDAAMRKGIPIVAYEKATGEPSPLNDSDESCVAATGTVAHGPKGSDQLLEREGFEKDSLEDRTLETPIPFTPGPPQHPNRPVVDRAWNMVVEGDRQAAYGHPNSDFTAMGRISAAILSRWLESEGLRVERVPEAAKMEVVYLPDIPPRIATMLMQSVKLSREAAKPNQDNRDDSVGYMICTDRSVKAGTPDEY